MTYTELESDRAFTRFLNQVDPQIAFDELNYKKPEKYIFTARQIEIAIAALELQESKK